MYVLYFLISYKFHKILCSSRNHNIDCAVENNPNCSTYSASKNTSFCNDLLRVISLVTDLSCQSLKGIKQLSMRKGHNKECHQSPFASEKHEMRTLSKRQKCYENS